MGQGAVSRSQGLKVSRSQGLKVSRSQGLKVSMSQGPKVSRSQGDKVSRSQGAKVSSFHGPIIPRSQAYLIFVIFFTLANFLENKIYTEKRQFFALNL